MWSSVPARVARALSLSLLIPALAFAVETGHGEHAEAHGIPWASLLFSAVNFVLFLALMRRVALPGVRLWARERRERIVRELNEAAALRADAERLRAEWEARLQHLDVEIAAIHEQARADTERERERILQAAQATAAAIEADARRAVDQELRRAQSALRDEVAREAVVMAERLIRERATADDQRRFVDEFLHQVTR